MSKNMGSFGCRFYPEIKGNPTITKIQLRNNKSDNESKIGSIISNIPSYTLFFLPVMNECPINLRKISQKEISKCKIIKSYKHEYVAMEMPYIKSIKFIDIIQTKTAKEIILILIESYKYLLTALDKLQQVNIVHFDLKLDNMLFCESSYYPRIVDFGIAIPTEKLSDSNLKNFFYGYAPEYYVWCIDIHIICFLLYETKNIFTLEDAETIAVRYVENNRALDFFPKEFRQHYLDLCIAHIKTYVNSPTKELIWKLIGYSNTWDNYSLSVMYLRVITLLFPKDTFIDVFGKMLVKNIHPDPQQRLTITDSMKHFSDIFYMDISVEKYLNIAQYLEEEKYTNTQNIITEINSI